MTKLLKAAGRILRRSLAGPALPTAEDYISGAGDRLDVEMRSREWDRRISGRANEMLGIHIR